MAKKVKLPEARNFNSSQAVVDALAEDIIQQSAHNQSLALIGHPPSGNWIN